MGKSSDRDEAPDGTRIVTASLGQDGPGVGGADPGNFSAGTPGPWGMTSIPRRIAPDGIAHRDRERDPTAQVWGGADRETAEPGAMGTARQDRDAGPDGTRIVTASSDKTAQVWEAQTGKLSQSSRAMGTGVRTATYSPDGTRIVTASDPTAREEREAQTGTSPRRAQGAMGIGVTTW